MDKLKNIFSRAHYLVKNIYDGLKGGDKKPFGQIGIQMIKKEVLEKFANKLKERGIELETYDSIKDIYDLLRYPIDILNTYFNRMDDNNKTNINTKTAHIFYFFIREHIKELGQIAEEIDAEYSQ